MTAPVPPQAVTAAEETLRAFLEPWLGSVRHGQTLASQIRPAAAIAVRDAAPAIVSAARLAHAHEHAAITAQAVRTKRNRIAELEQLAQQILDTFHPAGDGRRARAGQVQIARWQTTLNDARKEVIS